MNLSFLKNYIPKICDELLEDTLLDKYSEPVVKPPKPYHKSDSYKKALSKLLDEKTGLTKVLSVTKITDILNNLIKERLGRPIDTKQINEDINIIIDLASNIKEYKTFIPIKGLDMDFPPFTKEFAFSSSVKVCYISEDNLEEFLPTKYLADEEITDLVPTIIEVKSHTADVNKSMELTVEVGKYIVNFIRYVDYYGWDFDNLSVRIPGYGGLKENMFTYGVSEDSEEILRYHSGGVHNDYEFDINEILENGANKFGDLLEKYIKHQLESMEKSLLRAIVWFGESKADHDLGARFLKLTLAMESLLNTNDSGPITSTLRDRTAFILDNSARNRLVISSEINELYRQRSAIVHHGKTEVGMQSLYLLESYAAELIRAFLTDGEYRTMRTKDELQKKMDILKYS
ncbi:hypothetical protein ABER68_04170 [Paenibacillus alvei]